MKYTTVIFDLDGTLLDTIGDLAQSVNYTLEYFGHERISLDEVRNNVGYGLVYMLRHSFPVELSDSEMQEVLKVYKAYYAEHMSDLTVPYEGVAELLEGLKSRNINIAVNTNKYHEAAKTIIEYYYPGMFAEVLGDGCGFARKPEAEAVWYFIDKVHGTKRTTLYVGDSEADFATAKNAGTDCLLVSWGLREKKELEALGPDYIIDRADEFFEVLDRG